MKLWASFGGARAALGAGLRALSAAPLGVPGMALRPRWPGGYQARLRTPGSAMSSITTHPLDIIELTSRTVSESDVGKPAGTCEGFVVTGNARWATSVSRGSAIMTPNRACGVRGTFTTRTL